MATSVVRTVRSRRSRAASPPGPAPAPSGRRAVVRAAAAVVVALASLVPVAPVSADEAPQAQALAAPTEPPAPNTVTAYGAATDLGPDPGTPFAAALVGISGVPGGNGYWLVAGDGGVFSFGTAGFHGSMGGRPLNRPIVGMAAHPSGNGYWLVASDGGIFSFGTAPFHGSQGGDDLPFPIVGMAASPDGDGYWLAAEDGQVYANGVTDHGNAAEHEQGFRAPTVDIAAHGPEGYWLVHGTAGVTEVEDEGPHVAAIQRRLTELGYWLGPVDGAYGDLTEQAVYAFQKYEGLPVDGEVDARTLEALGAARRPTARTTSGDVIEVDKARQLLFFVDGGQVRWVFNTSTGTEQPYTHEGVRYLADTPPGRWEITRQVDGYRTSNLGRLYRPKYFHVDGIAIHGYSLVPPYPASHGCVRVSNAAIDHIWATGLAPIGADVWVYGQTPPV